MKIGNISTGSQLTMADYRTLAARLEKAAVALADRDGLSAGDWARLRTDRANARRDLERFVGRLLPLAHEEEPTT